MINLKKIICDYPEAKYNSKLLKSLLTDYYPEYIFRRQINLLVVLINTGIVSDILKSTNVDSRDIAKYSLRLENELGYNKDLTRECIELWANALGKYISISDDICINELNDSILDENRIKNDILYAMSGLNINDSEFEISSGCLTRYKGNSKEVVIPEGVVVINENAFIHNETVERIILPESVKKIKPKGVYASKLKNIYIENQNKYFKSVGGVLFDNNMKTLIQYPIASAESEYSIPEGIEKVEGKAFAFCKNLTKINFPISLRIIDESSFTCCDNIRSIFIGRNVELIGENAFMFCSSLNKAYILNDNITIQDNAFGFCSMLKISANYGSNAQKYAKRNNIEFIKFSY